MYRNGKNENIFFVVCNYFEIKEICLKSYSLKRWIEGDFSPFSLYFMILEDAFWWGKFVFPF